MIIHMLDILAGDCQEIIFLLELLVYAVIDLTDIVLIGGLLGVIDLLYSQSLLLRTILLPAHQRLCVSEGFLNGFVVFSMRALFREGGVGCFI